MFNNKTIKGLIQILTNNDLTNKSLSFVLILYNTSILPSLFSLSLGYKVTRRGQMHVSHLKELATKISGLQFENAEIDEVFSLLKFQTLCKVVLRGLLHRVGRFRRRSRKSSLIHKSCGLSWDSPSNQQRHCTEIPSGMFIVWRINH